MTQEFVEDSKLWAQFKISTNQCEMWVDVVCSFMKVNVPSGLTGIEG